ncbi:MAG: class D sortase [Acidobacteria bacterium]|nr:class D sortase [Acidobacteriota bacterium]
MPAGHSAPLHSFSTSALRWIERGFLAVGLLLLSTAAAGMLNREWSQEHDARWLEAARREPAAPARRPRENDVVGRIEIDRIGLSVSVREGDGARVLRVAAGHPPATPLPGENGNVVVAGHRDSSFRTLKEIRPGDRVRFSTPWHVYEYVVAHTSIVAAERMSVLDPTPQNTLTLITCYPFGFIGPAPQRFIVRALEVDRSHDAEAEAGTARRPPMVTANRVARSARRGASR